MHDPDTNSFSWQPLIITKVRAKFGSQRASTFSGKVDFTNTHTHTRREIRYRRYSMLVFSTEVIYAKLRFYYSQAIPCNVRAILVNNVRAISRT